MERQQLLRGIPELLRNIRERLNSISFDQHKMAKLFKELQNCHICVLRGGESGQIHTAGTAPVSHLEIHFPDSSLATGPDSQLRDMTDETVSLSDDFTQQAIELETGEWLEIMDGNSKARVKLSWKSKVTDTYIFVNRKGMKAMELTTFSLANHFRDGTAKRVTVSTKPIMDRALDAMLDALKNTTSTPASA
jgi:hypothetical protein